MRPLIIASLVLLQLALPGAPPASAHSRATELRKLLAPLTGEAIKEAPARAGVRELGFETSGVVEPLWKRWRAAREAEGWRLVLRYPAPAGRAFGTLTRRGRMLTLVLSQRSRAGRVVGSLSLVSPRRAPKLKGRCQRVVERRFEILVHVRPSRRLRRFRRRRGIPQPALPRSTRWVYRTRYHHDFDGDGLLDALVPLSKRAHCPGSVPDAIYLTRCRRGRCCGYRVGVIDGGRLDTDALRTSGFHNGAKEIVTRLERSEHRHRIPDRVTYVRRYRLRAGRYRLVKTKRSAGRCHHCYPPSCTGPIRIRTCPLSWPDRLGFAALKEGVHAAAKRARRCLGRPLKNAKGGILRVSLTVRGPTGRIKKLKVGDGDPVDAKTARCVRRALKVQRFPRACAPENNFSTPFRLQAAAKGRTP